MSWSRRIYGYISETRPTNFHPFRDNYLKKRVEKRNKTNNSRLATIQIEDSPRQSWNSVFIIKLLVKLLFSSKYELRERMSGIKINIAFSTEPHDKGAALAWSRDGLLNWRETWIGSESNFRLPSPHRKRLLLKFPTVIVPATKKLHINNSWK